MSHGPNVTCNWQACDMCRTPEQLAEVAAQAHPHPVYTAPLPVDPECESSGCDCDDEFDTFYPLATPLSRPAAALPCEDDWCECHDGEAQ